MSVSSSGSQISINYNGQECDLEQMLDLVITGKGPEEPGIQSLINQIQYTLRNLVQCEDRGDTYQETVSLVDEITDMVDDISILFEDLKTVAVQVLGKPETPELKEWYAQHKLKRKEQKAKEKLENKASKVKVSKLDAVKE